MHTRTIYIVAALLLLGLGLVWFFVTRGPDITNLNSSGTSIVAFGDSLIYGTGASKGNDLVSLLSRSTGTAIKNLGVPGNTTADALSRIDEVTANDPRIVILLLGGNDYLRGVPADQIFTNLGKIITALQEDGAAVLLLGVRGGIFTDSFAERFEELAVTYKTGFVPDVLNGLLGKSAYMADAVHPNDAGYQEIAARVEPVLREMLSH